MNQSFTPKNGMDASERKMSAVGVGTEEGGHTRENEKWEVRARKMKKRRSYGRGKKEGKQKKREKTPRERRGGVMKDGSNTGDDVYHKRNTLGGGGKEKVHTGKRGS